MKTTRGKTTAGMGKRLLSWLLILTMIWSMFPDALAENGDPASEEPVNEAAVQTVDPELVIDPETITIPETVTDPETITVPETVTDPEPVTDPEAVTDPEPVTDPESVDEGDPTADVETEAEWTAAFSGMVRTGHYGADLLAVARTQLAYAESTENYVTAEGGRNGYTRYGAWYGDAYMAWNAAFVSFCLNYAGIPAETFPSAGDAGSWMDMLKAQGAFEDACRYLTLSEAEEAEGEDHYALVYIYGADGEATGCERYYLPEPGDLALMDTDGDGTADRVGIVSCTVPGADGAPQSVGLIEGDVDDAVVEHACDGRDGRIVGYGRLPVNKPAQTLTAGTDGLQVVAYAAAGTLPAATWLRLREEGEAAFSLHYIDVFGREIRPAAPARVTLKGEATADAELVTMTGEVAEAVETEPTEGGLSFDDAGAAVYALLKDEQPAEPEEEPEDEPEEEPAETVGEEPVTEENTDPEPEPEKTEDTTDAGETKPEGFRTFVENGIAYVEVPQRADEALLSVDELSAATLAKLGAPAPALGEQPDQHSSGYEPQDPVTADGVTIEKISIRWLSASTGEQTSAKFGDLMLAPQNDIAPNQQFQIDFALSGKGRLPAGSVEIVMPAYIWFDRDGNEPGLLTLAIPEEGSDVVRGDYVWKRMGDKIVITNIGTVMAASKVMIQGTFRMTSPDPNSTPSTFTTTPAHQMVDDTWSDALYASIVVTTPNEQTISMDSNTIYAHIDTFVEAAAASKTAYDKTSRTYYIYFHRDAAEAAGIPDELMEKLPDEEDDYLFIKWYVDGRIVGNQPYTMTMDDTLSGKIYKVEGNTKTELDAAGYLLGATDGSEWTKPSEDGKSISVTMMEDGYTDKARACYVWVAYAKSDLEEGAQYEIGNAQTITVTGMDDHITTQKTAEGTVAFRLPIIWKIDKVWNDAEAPEGRRPESIKVWLNNRSTGAEYVFVDYLSDENNWHTEWEDDGSIANYEAYEVNYYVSMATYYKICGGYGEWEEHDNGVRTRYYWWYGREKTEYDEETHTFTFTNKYHETYEHAVYSLLELSKTAVNHTNYQVKATSDKDISLLRDGKETTPLRYYVQTSTMTLAHTTDLGKRPSDPEALGAYWVTLEAHDTKLAFQGRYLDKDEYYIAYVDMIAPQIYAWEPDENGEMAQEYIGRGNFVPTDTVPVTLSGLLETGDGEREWLDFAVLDNGVLTTSNGATAEGLRVTLPRGVTEVKTRINTNMALANMPFYLGIVILPSEQVQTEVQRMFETSDYVMGRAENHATSALTYTDDESLNGTLSGQPIMDLERWDTSYLHGRNYRLAVDLDKDARLIVNDRENKRLGFSNTVTLNQQSNIANEAEYYSALADDELPLSESGVFYDLLPEGMVADEGTFRLDSGTIVSVDIIENYHGSGRQLVIVRVRLDETPVRRSMNPGDEKAYDDSYPNTIESDVTLCGTKATLYFESWYSYEEAMNRGLAGLRNTAAYEADEPEFGNLPYWSSENDAPSGEKNKESTTAVPQTNPALVELMTDLDPDRDDDRYVYAGADYISSEVDFSADTSLVKYVQAVGSDEWKTGIDGSVNVFEGGKYSYQITLTSGVDTTTKDIILLDSLETYTPMRITDAGDSLFEVGQIVSARELAYENSLLAEDGLNQASATAVWYWMGKFRSIDVTELEAMGVKPVVYYSTVAGLDVSVAAYNPDQEAGVVKSRLQSGSWTTTLPEDPSTVTAIAIDCSKRADGSDFELEEKQSLIVYVHMISPTNETAPEAFSETEYSNYLKNAHAFNNAYMDVTQIDDLGNVTHSYDHFDYTQIGIYGYDLNVEKEWDDADDNDGIRPSAITVNLLRDGADTGRTVVLSEETEWKGKFEHVLLYDEDGLRHVFTLEESAEDGDGDLDAYTATITYDGFDVRIVNRHEPETIEIPFEKKWESEEPEGWEVNIPDSIQVRLYADGVFTGKTQTVRAGLNGRWEGKFEEMLRYDHGREIVYTVDEVTVPVNFYKEVDDASRVITNTYYPYGNLSVEKTVLNATAAALEKDFTFTLELSDADGDPVIGKYDYTICNADGEEQKTGKIGNGDTFVLKNGWKLYVEDIPTRVNYAVTEANRPGFTLTGSTGSTGTITAEADAEAKMVNTYASTGSVQLATEKTLIGQNEIRRGQFTFQVYDGEGKLLGTATTAASDTVVDGKVVTTASFGRFNYTEANDGETFEYTVHEVNRGKPGYTYDVTQYRVKVTPHDNGDGTMSCDEVYEKYDVDADTWTACTGLSFDNEYHAKGDIVLRAWKVLKGGTLEEDSFRFELLDENRRRLTLPVDDGEGGTTDVEQVKSNAADGSVVFDALHYTEANVGKTYLYYARELPGEDPKVIYSNQIFGYYVTVFDNGDGTLSFLQGFVDPTEPYKDCSACEGTGAAEGEACAECGGMGRVLNTVTSLPVFTNELEDGSLSVTKYTEDAPADDQTEFTFKVVLTGDDVEDGERDYTLTPAPERTPAGGNDTHPAPAHAAGRTIRRAPLMHIRRMDPASTAFHATDDMLQGTAYAVLTDAGELIFFRSNETYASGDAGPFTDIAGTQYNGTIYVGFETSNNYSPPWYSQRNSIKKVSMAQAIKPVSCSSWFSYDWDDVSSFTEADLSLLDTSSVTSMYGMFSNCSSLTTLNITHFDTSMVSNMTDMFARCSSLTRLNVSSFDTRNVTSMQRMFELCSALTSLDLSNFDTSKVTAMGAMFYGCSSLTSLIVSGFNTELVTDFTCGSSEPMFGNCSSLTSLDLSSFNTPRIPGMNSLFSGCTSLTYLNISNFDTRNVIYGMNYMFKDTALSTIVLGPYFSFQASILPEPPTTAPYTGKWMCLDEPNLIYTATELQENYNGATDAGTWVWDFHGYTIKFEPGDGVGGSMLDIHGVPDVDLTINNRYYKFNHTFVGFTDGTNTFTAGDGGIVRIPANTYEMDQVVTLIPLFEENENKVTVEDGAFTFTLHGGETATFDDIPAGTAYQVYEMTPDGWVLIEQVDASGVIEPLETAQAIFTNRYQPGVTTVRLYGTKLLDNRLVGENDFSFELVDTTEGSPTNGQVIKTTNTLDGGLFQFEALSFSTMDYTVDTDEIANGESKTYTYTYTYDIREVVGGDSTIEYDKHKESVTVTVTLTVTKNEEGLVHSDIHAEETYDEDGASFRNYKRPGVLTITKTAENQTEQNKDADFTFEITFQNANGMPLGDEIYWYVRDRDGSVVTSGNGSHPAPYASGRGLRSHYAPLTHIRRLDPASGVFHASDDMLEGTAYAIYTNTVNEGELIFFRSDEDYANGSEQTVMIEGREYTGIVYAGFETAIYSGYSSVPWFHYYPSIKIVRIAAGQAIRPVSLSNWFSGNSTYGSSVRYRELSSVDLSRLDTSETTQMKSVFCYCYKLTSLDFSGFDTSKVTDMSQMLDHCEHLKSLNLSNFDTSKVTNMSAMFRYCRDLTSLDLSGFITSEVTDMSQMFYQCDSLTSLDVSSFNTAKVTDMSRMFDDTQNIATLDLSGFNTSNVTNMFRMFGRYWAYNKLTSINLSSFDTSNVTNMAGLFSGCSNLTSIDLTNFNTANVTDMGSMFSECSRLSRIDLSSFDTSKVTNMRFMFSQCSGLEEVIVDKTKFTTAAVESFDNMFQNDQNLKKIDASFWNTSQTTDFQSAFRGCSTLPEIDISGWDTGSATRMDQLFGYCNELRRVTLGKNFSFKGNNIQNSYLYAILPTPSGTGYTGNWVHLESGLAFTPEELRDNYDGNTMYGTWVWEVDESKGVIYFDANGGYVSQYNISVTADEPTVVMPDETMTSRPGHDLTVWTTNQDGTGTQYQPGESYENVVSLGASVVLYAQWVYTGLYKYTVEYYQESAYSQGSYSLADTETARAMIDTTVSPEANPEKYDGFHFGHSDPASAVIVTQETAKIRHYYDRNRYTLAFDGNGADGGETSQMAMIGGVSAPLPECGFYRKGYICTGWKTEPDTRGPVTVYSPGESVMNLAGDGETITLYAQWTGNDNVFDPTSGSLTVTIKAGQTIVIPDLPDGTTYTVRETDLPDGWVQTGSVNAEGSIPTSQTVAASFTNTYHADGQANLVAHKHVVGGTPQNGQFTFTLQKWMPWASYSTIDTKTNGPVDTDAEIAGEGDENQPNPWVGTAPVIFDPIEYTEEDIGTHSYRIVETPGGDRAYDYDSHTELVTVEVFDNGDGTLGTTVTYDDDGALFTNTLKPGALAVSKKILNATPAAEDTEFTFTLSLFDAAGNELTGTYPIKTVRNWSVTESVEEVTKYSHTSNISDAGERDGNYASYLQTTDVVQIEGAESLNVTVTYGTESGYDYLYIFQGEYSGSVYGGNMNAGQLYTLVGGGDTTSTVTCEIPGDTVTFCFYSDSGVNYYGYYAVIEGTGKTVVEQGEEVSSGTIASGGTVTLRGGDSFRVDGLPNGATYILRESAADGWEQTGSVNAEGIVRAGQLEKAVFTNTYSTSGEAKIHASKIYKGGSLSKDVFTFVLTDQNGNILQQKDCSKDGEIVFSVDYEADSDGVNYVYYIQELVGENELVDYDESVHEVNVSVADNGRGKLETEVSYPDDPEGVSFTNVALRWLEISKTVTGNMGDYSKEFSFTLTLTDEDGEPMANAEISCEDGTVLTLDGNGRTTLTLSHGESIRLIKLPHGTGYRIEEIIEDAAEDYSVSVRVGDGDAAETTVAEGVLAEDTTVAYTNDRTVVIPTSSDGQRIGVAIGAVTLLPLLMAILLMKKKQRREQA